jgi:DNA (cytosine-5)-methyltransferase 1
MADQQYTFGSLFAGIGGICLGFSQAGFVINWANELDKFACKTYRYNEHGISPELDITECDIRSFNAPGNVDVLGGGFPCQPYSVAGLMQGLDDDRGMPMFNEILRIAQESNPRVIFLENVGNLKSFDNGRTFELLMDKLKKAGYPFQNHKVLNSKDYSGIAQYRSRIYIVAFREERDFYCFKTLFESGLKKVDPIVRFNQIVEDGPIPEKYYYSQNDRSKCVSVRYYEHFVPSITEKGVFYQYRRNKVRKNKNGLCPALTASMGGGGHNVPIILDDVGIRKLTPRECLNVQGFPEWYDFPEDMADCHKYRQVGNSVTVPLIKRYAEIIYKTLVMSDLTDDGGH